MLRRRLLAALTVLALMLNWAALAPQASAATNTFTKTTGFATKTGFRFVFAWESSEIVFPTVHFGTSPGALTETAFAFPVGGTPDKAGMAIFDDLDRSLLHQTIYWQLTDDLDPTNQSTIKSFKAENAYNAWDPIAKAYTINLLVQLDSDSLPEDIPADQALADIAAGMNVFSERLYDATDKFVRLGEVIVTDTNLDFPANVPFLPPACFQGGSNAADVLIQTTLPFDSHTFGGWSIDDPCIGFYVGRIGQLVVPWEDDLHFGYVATHEMSHYALNAPDLYDTADIEQAAPDFTDTTPWCKNLAWDGSLMHNSGGWNGSMWELTELDRNPTLTPCDHASSPYTWDVMRQRYTNVPLNPTGPIDHMFDNLARGNEDGGVLNICILDREQETASSTYSCIVPDDGQSPPFGNPCKEPGLLILSDPQGDSAFGLAAGLPEHDVRELRIAEPNAIGAGNMVFTLKMEGMTTPTPNTTWPVLFKDQNGADRWVRMQTDAAGVVSFGSGTGTATTGTTGLVPADPSSSFSPDGTIRIVVARANIGNPLPGNQLTAFLTRIQVVAVTPDNMPDSLARSGSYTILGSENCSDAENNPPVAVDDSASTAEETPVIVSVLANDSDPDGDTVSLSSVGTPANGTATKNGDGTATYSPNLNFNGTDSFTYNIADGKGGSDTGLVTVTVSPGYDPPQAFDDSASTNEGSPVTVNVLSNDVGDALDVTSATNPPSGTAVVNGNNTITYTPDLDFNGTDSFEYTITDGTSYDTAQVVVTVRPAGSADPCVVPGMTILTDPSGDQLPGSGDAYDIQTISVAGLFVDDGTLVLTQKVAGGLNPPPTSSSWRINWKFRPVGALADVEYWVGMDTFDLVSGLPTFSYGTYDATLGFVTAGIPDAGSFTPDGTITIKIAANKVGNPLPGDTLRNFVGRAQLFVGEGTTVGGVLLNIDGTTNASPAVALTSFTLDSCTTAPLNGPPSAINDTANTNEDTSVLINVVGNDSDPDGDSLTVTQVGTPANGTATDNGDGTVTYSPNPNFNGTDSFSYTISDGEFGSTAQVTVTVAPTNDPPDAVADSAQTEKKKPVTISVLANDTDADGDSLTVISANDPPHGKVTINANGTITYTPDNGYVGSDSFQYTISDGHGGTDTASVAIQVNPRDGGGGRGDSGN